MLSQEIENKLVEILVTLSLGEEKINNLKQNIFLNIDLDPIKIFFLLDLDNVGYLSKNDFLSLFKFFSIDFTITDIEYIFFFYDKNEDNILCFDEFLDLIISDNNHYFKKLFKKKFKNNDFNMNELNFNLGKGIEKAFLELMIEEINLARNLNLLIEEIERCSDFSIENIFYEIKSYSYITKDSLKAFLDRNDINYNDKFIKNIFIRFNSKDLNGKIVFNKFKKFFNLSFNINNNEPLYKNEFSKNIDLIYIPEDIKCNDLNKNKYQESNCDIDIKKINSKNICNNTFKNNFNNNENDIQLKCSHLSRSGSIESFNKEIQNSNCKYIPKNKRSNSMYKNYLREKRSKSLQKSLKKTINFIKNLKSFKPLHAYYYNKDNHLNTIESSIHEDLPVKLPIRLDRNIILRKVPMRNNRLKDKNMTFRHFSSNYFEDIKIKHDHKKFKKQFYRNPNDIANYKNMDDIYYNYDRNDVYKSKNYRTKYNSNDSDIKIYREDIKP